MKRWIEQFSILLWVCLIVIVANYITFKVPLLDSLGGVLLLIAITLIGMLLSEVIPGKLPAVFWISIVGLLLTSPFNPYGTILDKEYLGKINFLAIATPILAYAGLAVGKDLKLFRELSWRIVIVALVVYTGTFLGAAVIAETIFRITGVAGHF